MNKLKVGSSPDSIEKFFSERLVGFIINGVLKYKKNVIESLHNEKVIAILEEQRFFMTKTVDAISKSLTTSNIIGEQNTDKIIENYLKKFKGHSLTFALEDLAV